VSADLALVIPADSGNDPILEHARFLLERESDMDEVTFEVIYDRGDGTLSTPDIVTVTRGGEIIVNVVMHRA